MNTVLAATALSLIAILKISMFAVSVRNAIRPRPLPIPEAPVDPDGPDDGWRWWEDFDPEPDPPEPVESRGPEASLVSSC